MRPSEPKSIAWDGYHFTTGDVSGLLNVDVKTVHNWVDSGRLQGYRTKGRHLRFWRLTVVRLLRELVCPVPSFVGANPLRTAVEVSDPQGTRIYRSLSRGGDATPCVGLVACSLVVASGDYEAIIVPLEKHPRKQVKELLAALRDWTDTRQVCVIGVSDKAILRGHFLDDGGDVTLGAQDLKELRATLRWLVGAKPGRPASVESRFER